jgi:Smr domain
MNIIKIGDKVSVLDDIISGIVVGIGENITIETKDGFHLTYQPNELVLIKNTQILRDASQPSMQTLQSKIDKAPKKSVRIKSKERNKPAMEVDLHIQQLVKNERGMAPHEILTLQIDTAKHKLDFAFRKKIQKIVFIHGVGEGVLRAELEYLFRQYNNLNYYDADLKKYGLGAVEVYVFQNKKP